MIAAVGIIVCGFFAYANYSQINTRADYIEACLYISNTKEQKEDCYSVYPENHSQTALLWAVVTTIGLVSFLVLLLADSDSIDKREQ